jgi:hypothetical protein
MSVEDVDLVNGNEDRAGGGGWPFGTMPLQVIPKLPERFPDVFVRVVSSIRNDIFIKAHSI